MAIPSRIEELMRYAHLFRRDEQTCAVVTDKPRVKRDGSNMTLCAQVVDQTFQRRIPSDLLPTPVTCEQCLRSMTGLMELLERENHYLIAGGGT